MNRRTAFIVLALLIQSFSMAKASGVVTNQEIKVLDGVAICFAVFAKEHDRLPISWSELESVMSLRHANELVQRYGHTLPDRYVFLSRPVPLAQERGRDIVMARVVPMRERVGERPRWTAIYRNPDGSFGSSHYPVEQIQRSFQAANYEWVRPPGLPEIEMLGPGYFNFALQVMLVAAVVAVLIAMIRGKRRADKELPAGD